MFLRDLYRAVGMELEIHNIIVDYTLKDGKTRAHNTLQIIGNGAPVKDVDIVAQVKAAVPEGSRICLIREVAGDFEMRDLSDLVMAENIPDLKQRCIYVDEELVKEYMREIAEEQ